MKHDEPITIVRRPAVSQTGTAILLCVLGCAAPCKVLAVSADAASDSTQIEAGFLNPPAAAKPRVFWMWVSGNVAGEGITADLEAMKRIGLGGFIHMTIDTVDKKGPVKFLSPEWRKLMQHTLTECDRLGLECTTYNCEGWTESGGPWITPAQAMQQVVWSETRLRGGQTLALTVPRPTGVRGYYEDIATIAFPSIPGDMELIPQRIKTSTGEDSDGGTRGPTAFAVELPAPTPDHPQWIEFSYPEPVTCSTFRVESDPVMKNYMGKAWELQTSEDGKTFRTIAALGKHVGTAGSTMTFPETRGKLFRLYLPAANLRLPNYYVWISKIKVTKLALAGPRLDRAEARAAGLMDRDAYPFTDGGFPAANVVARKSIVDLTGRAEWDAPAGDWTVVRIGHTATGATNNPAIPEQTGLECDKMSQAAVESHLQQGMLSTLIADAGPHVGRALKFVHCDSWECGCANWTPLMRPEFQQRRGYDLWPWLLVLTGRVVESVDASERFLWDFRRTVADLVADHHYGVFREFAHRHGMTFCAEAVGTKMPTVADQLQCKGRTDLPMGEFWCGKPPSADAKETASAAHIYGRNIAACEAFTSQLPFAHWTNEPYSMKALGDLHFCRGVNRFVISGCAHQPWADPPRKPGMTWGRWGTNFERTNTWYEPGAAWIAYLTRCQFLLQQGQFLADVCYFYGEGAPAGIELAALEPALPTGFDYDVCNAEVLLSASVSNGRVAFPCGMSYRVLVLPPTDRMTLPALQKIRALVQAGATVVGPRPARSPSLADYPQADRALQAIAADVWGDCNGKTVTQHRYGSGKVLWGGPLADALGVPPDFASSSAALLFIHRRAAEAELYFVSNQQAREMVTDCTFRVTGKVPELWHPDTGQRETAAVYSDQEGRTTLPIHFDPAGSVFVVFRRPAAAADPVLAVAESRPMFTASAGGVSEAEPLAKPPVLIDGKVSLTVWKAGTYAFATGSGRALVARATDLPPPLELSGSWRLKFPPQQGAPASVILPRLISWTESPYEGVQYFSGTATYVQDFQIPTAYLGHNRRIYLDLGTVKNLAEVSLNRKPLGVLWKEPFRIDITAAAKPGDNHLEIKVTNLWPNRMIGDQKLPEAQRTTWAAFNPFDSQSNPKVDKLPSTSGLLGPVLLRPAALLTAEPVVLYKH